jgi:hypothetical protein
MNPYIPISVEDHFFVGQLWIHIFLFAHLVGRGSKYKYDVFLDESAIFIAIFIFFTVLCVVYIFCCSLISPGLINIKLSRLH